MKIAILGAAALALSGCAALPMPLQPQDEQFSTVNTERAWTAIDAVDTVQTAHMKRGTSCDHEGDPVAAHIYGGVNPPPGRVYAVNIVLALVHASVSNWLDREVAKHADADDGSVGPWYVGRVVWYAASFAYSVDGVVKGREQSCRL